MLRMLCLICVFELCLVSANLCGDDVLFLCVSCCTSYSHRWPPTAWRHRQHGAADCDLCLGRGVHYLFVSSFVVVVFMVSQCCCVCCAVALVVKCVVCVALLVGLVVGVVFLVVRVGRVANVVYDMCV